MKIQSLNIIELFGGIGACTAALKRLDINVNILDYVEIDKFAVASYNAINNTDFKPQDITTWDKQFKNVDLICHGSPCQDFTIAGLGAGGDEGSGTRSSLMYETLRIVEKNNPKFVIWENVKNVLSKKHKHNFENYCNRMEGLGYTNYFEVLDAQNFGIPQHRERVFVISIRKFEFKKGEQTTKRLIDILEDKVDSSYFLTTKQKKALIVCKYNSRKHVTQIDKISNTLDTCGGGGREQKVIIPTLQARDYKGAQLIDIKD